VPCGLLLLLLLLLHQVGLGLIALLVTAIGEYVEGLKQEALLKAQQLIDEAAQLADQGAGKLIAGGGGGDKGGGAGPTYEVEPGTRNKKKKKSKGLGKMGIATKQTEKELNKTSTSAADTKEGKKMEP
jgi:hypothetical protein